MALSEIEQAFHGYDQGHRLLASSISLSPQEAALLDRLSDLSGFLPLDTEIPTYLTLYPCGRFYAVARTWPDRSGVRSGTVLTHTLLIPSRDLAAWEALDTLWALHRVPHGVDDRSPYEQSLAAPLPSFLKWESPRDDIAFSTVAGLLLGRAERPAVVIAAVQHEDLLSRLWRVLWVGARARFAACTFALSVRRTDRGPFDLLVAPPSARASFADVARAPSLWDTLRLRPPRLAGVQDQPWFGRFLDGGPAWRDALVAWCAERILPMPSLSSTARLERMRMLDAGADERVTAARGRLDALGALWPALPGDHAYLRVCVQSLVTLQHAAPDIPSPFRSLLDLVSRPEVVRVALEAKEVADAVEATLRAETAERIGRSSEVALVEMATLYEATPLDSWRAAIVAGVVDAFVRESESGRSAHWLKVALAASPELLRLTLGVEFLNAVSVDERVAVLERVAGTLDEPGRRAIAGAALRVSARTFDLKLVVRSYELIGDSSRGGRRAITMALDAEGPNSRGLVLTEELPLCVRIAWCLGPVPERWQAFAVEHGARWVHESKMSGTDLAARCAAVDHGVRLLVRWLDAGDLSTAHRVLEQTDGWPLRIVRNALGGQLSEPLGNAFAAALELTADEDLLTDDLVQCIIEDRLYSAANQAMTRVGPLLVSSFARGLIAIRQKGLFQAPSWERWLRAQKVEGLRNSVDPNLWRGALPLAWPAFATLLIANHGRQSGADATLLVVCIREAEARAFDVALDVAVRWFLASEANSLTEALAAEVLVAVRRVEPDSAARWLETCFQIVYQPLVQNRRNPFAATLWTPGQDEWDLARNWREWLMRMWFEKGWAADGFLRTLHGDRRLLSDCCESLRYRYGRYEFVKALLAAASRDDTLGAWVSPLEWWCREFRPWYPIW